MERNDDKGKQTMGTKSHKLMVDYTADIKPQALGNLSAAIFQFVRQRNLEGSPVTLVITEDVKMLQNPNKPKQWTTTATMIWQEQGVKH